MKSKVHIHISLILLACGIINSPAIDRFVALDGGHVPPFTSWADAATNIQAAIDAASAGDTVWVTNGIYASGGKAMTENLTNRVALDKALTVQSVNGPWFTTIRGAGATNGITAIRCVWLTNGATLRGFTIAEGATRTTGLSQSGGGVWSASSNALVLNCLVISNAANGSGGGVYQGTIRNSAIIGNKSINSGAGAAYATLFNCNVISNYSSTGVYYGGYTNSIIYNNPVGNYSGLPVFSYCCTSPTPPGTGNISALPQLSADGIHLLSSSPCRGAGTNLVSDADIDGQPWANPPSIGCDEWLPEPVISGPPRIQLVGNPTGFQLRSSCYGQETFTFSWLKDGVPLQDNGHYSFSATTNLVATGISASDHAGYQMVASNVFGVVTSAVTQLRFHYVDVGSAVPTPPHSSWQTAATSIQDAIDAAAADEIVLVTNGIYSTGGRVMGGDLTNRVALNKPILVQSVNGPLATVIQGAWDPATNGPLAVRCAWLTNGAVLSGFTLCGGATRAISASPTPEMYGGGIWGWSTNAMVSDCRVEMNCASFFGGGAFQVTLNRCTLNANRAVGSGTPGDGIAGAGSGGGAYFCGLNECVVIGNRADQSYGGGAYACALRNCALMNNSSYLYGGAAYAGTLMNCTVTGNTSSGYRNSSAYGSAVYSATLINSLVWGNLHRTTNTNTNYASCTFSYSDTYPLPAGVGNISVDPQLLGDGYHLLETSPCRGAGTNLVSGTDIDGQPWNNPPAIGCDEWSATPLMLSAPRVLPGPQGQLQISTLTAAGQEQMAYYWFRDGVVLAGANYRGTDSNSLLINKLGPGDAGSYQLVASNAFGMATSTVAQVKVRCVDVAGAAPLAPYVSWATAATNIQTAIDASAIGDIVLVTNGVYGFGGKVMAGDLTNRIALDKALIVMSVNGAADTTIVGTPGPGGVNSPVAPNGANATRCVWMTDGAVLSGFTVRGGGTRASTDNSGIGGGVWCASPNALVTFCVIQENSAYYRGGGTSGGTLNNCMISANGAGMLANFQFSSDSRGGGAYNCNLNNCLVRGNRVGGGAPDAGGGGAWGGTLNNCTVLQNTTGSAFSGGGTHNGLVRNCIVRNNFSTIGFATDIYGGEASYSCYGTYSSGNGSVGNITNNPLFLIDGVHLSASSPCRGAGSASFASGTDMDGQLWTNPPSMGCDQWLPEPLILDFKMQATDWNQFDFKTLIAGIESSPGYWFKDGVVLSESGHHVGATTTALKVRGVAASDSGSYQLVVSNAFGMVTGRVANVVVHFVDVNNPTPSAPYTSWTSAAATIQEAIDVAANDGVILVTNGVYSVGGKVVIGAGYNSNRVVLDKPLVVTSAGGPLQTVIEGAWDPLTTNGLFAVRCALVVSNSSLAGFTLRNGATDTNGRGGGVVATSDALVSSCIFSNNRAYSGGAADGGNFVNCWFTRNSAVSMCGAAYFASSLENSTIVENSAGSAWGGVISSQMTNCVIWFNSAPSAPNTSSTPYYSCSPSVPLVSGNITNDPQLVDGLHLAATSPCRGAGAIIASSVTDLDGDVWLLPPAMGCDEFNIASLVGPLLVSIESPTNTLANHAINLLGRITGRASRIEWDFGDGTVLTNGSYATSHSWTNPGDYVVTFKAFNADTPGGVGASSVIHVDPVSAATLSGFGFSYSTNFQFQFGGQSGANYWVEYTTNLSPPITWLTVKSLTGTGGVEQIVDTKATNAARFYRVRAQ